MSRDKIIERVRKLLNLNADTTEFEGEIMAATKAAQDLIEKHAIAEAELGEAATQDEEQYGKDHAFTAGANLSQWEVTLAEAIARLVGTVRWYYQGNHDRKDRATGMMMKGSAKATKITYYGPAEDVAVACEMFSDISKTIVTMSILKWKGAFRGNGLSYCCGFASALLLAVKERSRAASVSSRQGISTELAVRSRAIMQAKKAKATTWLALECGIRLRAGKGRANSQSSFNSDAYGEGKSDGRAHGMSVSRTPRIGAQAALPE